MKDSEKKVKELIEKKKAEESEPEEVESEVEPETESEDLEAGRREIHPFDSNVIFREEMLVQLSRIADGISILANQNEKPAK